MARTNVFEPFLFLRQLNLYYFDFKIGCKLFKKAVIKPKSSVLIFYAKNFLLDKKFIKYKNI